MKQIAHTQHNSRLLAIFGAAMDLPPGHQAAYLDHVCAGDPSLRREVEAMLAADAQPTVSFLEPLHDREAGNARARTPPLPVKAVEHEGSEKSILPPGTRVGQHEIIRELGRGGMGAVYLARDTKLGRPVAIKVLHSNRAKITERFILEAKATARCSHENIVIIHEVGEVGSKPFMVLEYLRGHTLTREIGDRPLPPERAIELIIPVVRALVCAHAMGIVHRDLKPDNIIVTETGTVKVLDFGIAKVISEKRARKVAKLCETMESIPPSDTDYGVIIGTMPYMAPEQWRGETDNIDHRTDIWAVGIILYQMLTGRHPLAPRRGHQLMIIGVESQPMPSIRSTGVDLPNELAELVDHCLLKPRQLRMDSARTLLDALIPLLPGRGRLGTEVEESPYPGLAAFDENNADRFFGRSHDVAYMLACLRYQPLMGVVGPSGVGKSSFIRAGVVPALKRTGERWLVSILRPGRHPLLSLAGALLSATESEAAPSEQYHARALANRLVVEPGYAGALLRDRSRVTNRKILLFVDQFEELYTLVSDIGERFAFTNCLAGIADDPSAPLRVVISVRSDFLDRGAENRHFMTALTPGLVFLPPPDRGGLREALTKPAEMFGYRLESERMIEHMTDTLATTPGALPLLQFAATKLWEKRDRHRKLLTESRYSEIGGVGGALATHADELLNRLPPPVQDIVRAVFLRLVTPERTRAIASVSELQELVSNPADMQHLIDYLATARLLVVQSADGGLTGATVEIVHEVLIASWPRLAHWLDAHQEDAVFLEQLRTIAKQWQAKGCPHGMLWRGEAEEEARRFYRRYRGPLTKLQQQYLAAVFAAADRVTRTKRLAVMGSFVFLGTLVAAATVALLWIRSAEQEARHQAAIARAAQQDAEVQLARYEEQRQKTLEEEKRKIGAERYAALTHEQLLAAVAKLETEKARAEVAWRDAEKATEKANQLLDEKQQRIAALQKELGNVGLIKEAK